MLIVVITPRVEIKLIRLAVTGWGSQLQSRNNKWDLCKTTAILLGRKKTPRAVLTFYYWSSQPSLSHHQPTTPPPSSWLRFLSNNLDSNWIKRFNCIVCLWNPAAWIVIRLTVCSLAVAGPEVHWSSNVSLSVRLILSGRQGINFDILLIMFTVWWHSILTQCDLIVTPGLANGEANMGQVTPSHPVRTELLISIPFRLISS